MTDCGLLRVWCILGFLLSLYATYVEVQLVFDEKYKALCDLSPKLSCTAVFNSPYGKGFGLLSKVFPFVENSMIWNPPNGVFGLVYYLIMYATTNINQPLVRILQLILCILSNLMSIYLAYLLYIMNNICVVCISIYVVNGLCLWEMLKDGQTLWTQYLACPKRIHVKIN